MRAGEMTERVTLYAPTVVVGNFGDTDVTYTAAGTIWAEVQWKDGGTDLEAGEFFASERADIIIRRQHTVTEKYRIKHAGALFRILAIEPNRKKDLQRLICTRVNE